MSKLLLKISTKPIAWTEIRDGLGAGRATMN